MNAVPNVMIAVAGPQTGDAINASDKWMMLGVDTDQVKSFPAASSRFITSAEKDLKNSTIMSLAHTPEWKDQKVGDKYVYQIANDKYGDKISLTIENNQREFVELDTSINEDWTGQKIWVNGTMSHGGNNKVTEDLNSKIIGEFSAEILTNALKELFVIIGSTKEGETIITENVIKA